MYIKIATVRVKVKGKLVEKVYRYVRVVEREYSCDKRCIVEKVVATLGPLWIVRRSTRTLILGLENLPQT
jgi:hypothetical protein